MSLIGLLAQMSAFRLTIAIVASVLSGIADMGATICVLEYLRSGRVSWWQFGLVALVSVAIGRYSRSALNRMATKSVMRLRRRMVRSLLHVPLLDLERIGTTRLQVAFTTDLVSVGAAVRNLASLFANSAVILACLGYIGWLSPTRMVTTTMLCVLSIVGAVLLRGLEKRHRRQTREAGDTLQHGFNRLLDGIKELKINRPLARRVLLSFERNMRALQVAIGNRGRYADWVALWINGMFYVILGVAVFAPFGGDAQLKLGYGILALLRIRRPLGSLVADSGAFADASVALQRINDAGLTLSQEARGAGGEQDAPAEWHGLKSLAFEAVRFGYDPSAAEDGFRLGPLDMVLTPGEVVFVAGGNGSGKTTLAKLLSGLYAPTSGKIRLNGIAVDDANARWYRGKFAVLFADLCLFEDVAGPERRYFDGRAERLARRLKLDPAALQKPQPTDVPIASSAAEHRRVALLLSIVEDRPILVFDEWAADQDPGYKAVFYTDVLPQLRKAGKLVIVISHDERYFHIADRVLWLERGEPPAWKSPSFLAEAWDPPAERRLQPNEAAASVNS